LTPFFGVAEALIISHHLLNGELWILNLIDALTGHLCHPKLKRLCFGRRDGLNQAEKLFGRRAIRFAHFSVSGLHFESVTICNGLVSLILQSLFQHAPIDLRIGAVRQHTHNIYNGEIPRFRLIVPKRANAALLKYLNGFFFLSSLPSFAIGQLTDGHRRISFGRREQLVPAEI